MNNTSDIKTKKTDILSLTPEELTDIVLSLGYPKFRAKQIYEWMYKGCDFPEMSNLPAKMRTELEEKTVLNLPKIHTKLVSKLDGTVKYLFELKDGNCVESVVMRYHYGLSICISSQCGCRMGCRFCASTLGGKDRDLLPSELLGQIIVAGRDMGERISHVVMMGIGEPLDNYENVIKFLRLVNLSEGLGIGYRNISLSTCGIVPKIVMLAKENLPITLSISLHAADNETRSAVMPINNTYCIEELLTEVQKYFEKTGRRVYFEYTLIKGKNDSEKDVVKLASVLKKYLKCDYHVNLIPLNPVAEREFSTVDRRFASEFCEKLNAEGISATVRRTLGPDINASCGQLRRQNKSAAF